MKSYWKLISPKDSKSRKTFVLEDDDYPNKQVYRLYFARIKGINKWIIHLLHKDEGLIYHDILVSVTPLKDIFTKVNKRITINEL